MKNHKRLKFHVPIKVQLVSPVMWNYSCVKFFEYKLMVPWYIYNTGYTAGPVTNDAIKCCQNGGTPIDSNTCVCPGGLVGKYCESD